MRRLPRILIAALDSLADKMDIDNPSSWNDAQEQALISAYLKLCEQTSMTDSAKRAANIKKQLESGIVSDKRQSFNRTDLTNSF
jgi:hypothetical protein